MFKEYKYTWPRTGPRAASGARTHTVLVEGQHVDHCAIGASLRTRLLIFVFVVRTLWPSLGQDYKIKHQSSKSENHIRYFFQRHGKRRSRVSDVSYKGSSHMTLTIDSIVVIILVGVESWCLGDRRYSGTQCNSMRTSVTLLANDPFCFYK